MVGDINCFPAKLADLAFRYGFHLKDRKFCYGVPLGYTSFLIFIGFIVERQENFYLKLEREKAKSHSS